MDAPVPAASPATPLFRHPLIIAAMAAAVVIVIAATLPWASVLDRDIAGTSGDGSLTIALALVGAGGLLFGRGRMWGLVTMLVCAALVALIGLVDLTDVKRIADDVGIVETGSGLWLTVIAGIAWTLVSVLVIAKRRAIFGERSRRRTTVPSAGDPPPAP